MSASNQRTLADSGANEKPPMLKKGNYILWDSRFRRFLDNKLEEKERLWHSIEKGPYVRPMIPDPDDTRKQINKKQYIADVRVMNYLLQAIPNDIYNSVDVCKNAKKMWERIKRLMYGSDVTNHVNTNFLNTLPSEWSKFVTDVKLVRDLHTTNIDQLHAYLGQHEYHANEVRLMHERTSDPLALISQHHLNMTPYQHHQSLYHQSQFQQHATSYKSSPYATTYHNPQFVSQGSSSPNLSISYPVNDTFSTVNHSAYMASVPQIEYAPIAYNPLEFSSPETGLMVPVFEKSDDPIDAINHMMSFLTFVVASRGGRTICRLVHQDRLHPVQEEHLESKG
nr:hypothetical protein [Tanacetum cinerariifolium]